MPNNTPLLLSDLETLAIETRPYLRGTQLVLELVSGERVEIVRASEAHQWTYVGPLRLTTVQPGRGIVGRDPRTEQGRGALDQASLRWLREAARDRGEQTACRGLHSVGGHKDGADAVVDAVVTIDTHRWYFDETAGVQSLRCGNYALQLTPEDRQRLDAVAQGNVGGIQAVLLDIAGPPNRARLNTALGAGGSTPQQHLEEIRDLLGTPALQAPPDA